MFPIMAIITLAPVFQVWGAKVGTLAIVPWFIAYRVTDTICDAIKEKQG